MTDPIKAAMIRTLMLQIPGQTAAGLIVAFYMIGTAWAFNPAWLVLAWGAGILAAVFGRWAVGHTFPRAERPEASLARWAHLYTLAMTGIGMMYAVAFLLFAHPGQPITIALTLAALYSLAAGSTPSCAYHPPAILGAIIPSFAAVLGKLLLTGTFEFILLGAASALYGLTMIGYCRVQSQAVRDGFRIRYENVELVEQLQQEKAAADEARKAAEQANLAKSQFLAAVSHDLRQPLYALELFSSSLDELRLDRSGRDVVQRIQNSIGVMESSFEGLLDLSKLDAGIVKPRLEPVDVDALFDRINQVFGPLAAERGLELRFRSNGETVLSDAVLLEQVVGNLVSNALRATSRGGVLLATRPHRGALRFEVWDTGRGIAPDDLDRIFEDYVQLDNPQRDRRRGLGLGLAIARRSVALLDSRIDVASRLGRGSRFGFSQPLWSGAAENANGGSARELGVLRRGGDPLLLVEDDEDVRAALSDLLSRWGFAHHAEVDAEAALQRLTGEQRFSLLITDQRLPGKMTGLDLIQAMRSQLADPPPALLVTGEIEPLVGEAEAAGIVILQKPVRAAQLRCLLGA
jgi:two-component system, sensor histidine kinase